ncbi:MAG TPA: DUF6259 domain-containing protein [Verrucomicrobiota bacterium]|nr:DUF6259 domain-containing protein [Verrucomicrobiota bacterium]HNU50335.1 DUF6259 domain-containing protein [Verrucomicrobiota bacterium]
MARPDKPPAPAARPSAAVLLLCAVALALPAGTADVVRIGTSYLEVGVDRDSGRVVEFLDVVSGQDLIGAATGIGGCWELEWAGSPPSKLSPAAAQARRVRTLEGREPGLRIEWSRFGQVGMPDLEVHVTVRLDRHRPASRWGITVNGLGSIPIQSLRFPRLLDLATLEHERLAMPFWAGLLSENPRTVFAANPTSGVRREFDYPGHGSMQCMAFYSDGGPGLYAACDDTAGYRKGFAAFSRPVPAPAPTPAAAGQPAAAPRAAPGLNLEIVHLPEQRNDGSGERAYTLPYAAVLGTFRGNWFDAAAIYRRWATNQPWARESRWRRGAVPPWVAKTGLWVWNRGRSPGVLEPAIALQREAGMPVSVFWHWWHGCAYDTGFPEYLPPREGETAFAAALERAHAHDVHALVYMNQRLWGMTTASWTNENATAFAVKGPDGTVRPETYNTFTKLPCATMCLATEFWRRQYAGVAAEAFHQLGVDGIYMDQACSSLSCYDRTHGHPPGGGTYWMAGFRALAGDLRRRCPDRGGVALAGEGCAENWLPYLDLMLALDVSRERYAAPDGWDPIPFFQAVYHGYGVFYGNYSSLTMPPYDDLWPAAFAPKEPLALLDRKFSRQFCLEQARAFLWGQQPTLANFLPSQLRERSQEIAWVIRLARERHRALDWLQNGVMLPPPSVEAPSEPMPISRLSIYAGQQGALKEFEKTVPLVLASAWRARDGRVAVAVTTIADRPLRPVIALDRERCGLSSRSRARTLGDPDAPPLGECHGDRFRFQPELGPLDARVFVVRTE